MVASGTIENSGTTTYRSSGNTVGGIGGRDQAAAELALACTAVTLGMQPGDAVEALRDGSLPGMIDEKMLSTHDKVDPAIFAGMTFNGKEAALTNFGSPSNDPKSQTFASILTAVSLHVPPEEAAKAAKDGTLNAVIESKIQEEVTQMLGELTPSGPRASGITGKSLGVAPTAPSVSTAAVSTDRGHTH